VAGSEFAAIAREYSDDPKTRDQGGSLPFAAASAFPRDYAKAVFALKSVGDVSQPIRTTSAYHVARLDERRPSRQQTFDEVRDAVLKELRARYVAEQRDLRIKSIHADPELQMNQPAIDALVTHLDPVPGSPPAEASSRQPAPR
jgi:parvulin-like peptidyl-prolyl isomerase